MPNENEPTEILRRVVIELHDGCRAHLWLGTNSKTRTDGRTDLWFKLEHEPGPTDPNPTRYGTIFPWQGGFGASPLHADDSDESLIALMNFLALKPGDTDKEYFDDYTAIQLDWVGEYSDDLTLCAEEMSFEDVDVETGEFVEEEDEEERPPEGGPPYDAATATGMYDLDF